MDIGIVKMCLLLPIVLGSMATHQTADFQRKHVSAIGRRERTLTEFQAQRKHVLQSGRRQLETAEEVTQLETGIGTHYAYIWVGTPPQRQTVILDTGSFHTAFPCDPCTQCGDYLDYHESGPFEPDNSSTYVQEGGTWSASYAEGDGWTAHVSDDFVYLGGSTPSEIPLAPLMSMSFQFGCMFKLGGLFITQWADGIMGMGMNYETIVPKLVADHKIDRVAFGMCFAVDGGTLALGGPNNHIHNSAMQYSFLKKQGGFWGVTFKDLRIDQASIGAPSTAYGNAGSTIVDSGTTYTYIPTALAAKFKSLWLEVTGFAYNTDNPLDASIDITTLPVITFVLEGKYGMDVLVNCTYREYLDEWHGTYYPSIIFENGMAIMGANVMTNKDVYFDWAGMRIGWAESTCEWAGPIEQVSDHPTMSPTYPVTYACVDHDAEVIEFTNGDSCSDVAEQGFCSTSLCPTCEYPHYCDLSCQFCDENPSQSPTKSPSPVPMPTKIPTHSPTQKPIYLPTTTTHMSTHLPTQSPIHLPTIYTLPSPSPTYTPTLNDDADSGGGGGGGLSPTYAPTTPSPTVHDLAFIAGSLKLVFLESMPSESQIHSLKDAFASHLGILTASFKKFDLLEGGTSSRVRTLMSLNVNTVLLFKIETSTSGNEAVDLKVVCDKFMTNETLVSKVASTATSLTVTSDANGYSSTLNSRETQDDDSVKHNDDDEASLSSGDVAGVVIAVLVVMTIVIYLYMKYRKIKKSKYGDVRVSSSPSSSFFSFFSRGATQNKFEELEDEEETERDSFQKRVVNPNFASANLPMHNVSWAGGGDKGDIELASNRRVKGEGYEF